MSTLLSNLLHFGRVLRGLGLDVPTAALLDAAAAMAYVDIGRRSDFYFTLRSLLVHHRSDLATFDEAFRLFWRRPPNAWSEQDLRAMGEQRRIGPPEREIPSGASSSGARTGSRVETAPRVAPLSYSDREVLNTKDFAAFTDEEMRRARAMMDGLRWEPDPRRTRRWRSARGRMPDLRRLVGRSLRYGGEPVVIPTRARRWKRRPLVVLCDVSGSMERYARMLLYFTHGLASRPGRVEVFLFATRLTRITHEIARRGSEAAVSRVLKDTPDWGGGTRIGEALRTFNLQWARRVAGNGPVVLLISDGWDRGDPDRLAAEMARLARGAHRVIWLNPLLASPDYEPLTRGMLAALPFVDDLLPVHNLVSLGMLAAHLNALPPSRGGRRRSGPSSSARPSPADAAPPGR